MRRKLIAGNWKMNGLLASGVELARDLGNRAAGESLSCDLLVCPPATLLLSVGGVLSSGPISLGGQDCHTAVSGAHTGDLSAAMLADIGCQKVRLLSNHSRRIAGIEGFGIEVIERVPIDWPDTREPATLRTIEGGASSPGESASDRSKG